MVDIPAEGLVGGSGGVLRGVFCQVPPSYHRLHDPRLRRENSHDTRSGCTDTRPCFPRHLHLMMESSRDSLVDCSHKVHCVPRHLHLMMGNIDGTLVDGRGHCRL